VQCIVRISRKTQSLLENLGIFFINTEIATRKWILGDVDDENEEENE
jgi:hypothetical protein